MKILLLAFVFLGGCCPGLVEENIEEENPLAVELLGQIEILKSKKASCLLLDNYGVSMNFRRGKCYASYPIHMGAVGPYYKEVLTDNNLRNLIHNTYNRGYSAGKKWDLEEK